MAADAAAGDALQRRLYEQQGLYITAIEYHGQSWSRLSAQVACHTATPAFTQPRIRRFTSSWPTLSASATLCWRRRRPWRASASDSDAMPV